VSAVRPDAADAARGAVDAASGATVPAAADALAAPLDEVDVLAAVESRRGRRATPDAGGPITVFEAIAYTAVIGAIAAVAAGLFDPMLPWGAL
jgi:hypothetical protein